MKNIFTLFGASCSIALGTYLMDAPSAGGYILAFVKHTLGVWIIFTTGIAFRGAIG